MTVNEWIPNPGTGNPVREGETLTAIRFRDGSENDDCGHGSNWAWGKAGSLSITHYQVSPPRKAEPATMSADEVLIRAREAMIEITSTESKNAAWADRARRAMLDNAAAIQAILAYERNRAKPLAEVAPHTVEDPDEWAAYNLYKAMPGAIRPWGERHASSWYRSIRAAIKRGRELERGA